MGPLRRKQEIIVSLVFTKIDFGIRHGKCTQFKSIQEVLRLVDPPKHRHDSSLEFPEIVSYEVEVAWNIHSLRVSLWIILKPSKSKISSHAEGLPLLSNYVSRQWHGCRVR